MNATMLTVDWESPRLPTTIMRPWQVWERSLRDMVEEDDFAQMSWLSGGAFHGSGNGFGRSFHDALDSVDENGGAAAFAALAQSEQQEHIEQAHVGLQAFCIWLDARKRTPQDLAVEAAKWNDLAMHEKYSWELKALDAVLPLSAYQSQLDLLGVLKQSATCSMTLALPQNATRKLQSRSSRPETPPRDGPDVKSPQSVAPDSPPLASARRRRRLSPTGESPLVKRLSTSAATSHTSAFLSEAGG